MFPGFTFDFSPLKQVPVYKIDEDEHHTYLLSICGPLQNTSCPDNSGNFVVSVTLHVAAVSKTHVFMGILRAGSFVCNGAVGLLSRGEGNPSRSTAYYCGCIRKGIRHKALLHITYDENSLGFVTRR